MTIISQAISGAGWLALFKIIGQACSWTATIIVTRMLIAEDYGLMEMATIFTGYVALFVEFGIGSALVNKEKLDSTELSSAFWFSILWGILLSLSCFGLAPITASYYSEPRIYQLTQGASLLFILGALAIVPRSILQRDLRFKEIAIIEFITVLISCFVMVFLATQNAGAWTLLGGFIAREGCRFILFFKRSKFIPQFTFSKTLLAPLIRFGTPVMLSTSLFYVYNKADRFFGGTTFGAEDLGFYALALQLAAIPVEKIVSLLQGVLFPTLSKLKNNLESFNKVYLSFVSVLALVTLPLFIGGCLISPDFLIVLLGEKWRPAILPLQMLLIAQLFVSISAPNSLIHAARGKPKWNLIFNSILTPLMVASFYISSESEFLYQLALPWVTVFPTMQIMYIFITNKELGISPIQYGNSILHPVLACCAMVLTILGTYSFWPYETTNISFLILVIGLGGITYLAYFATFGRSLLGKLNALRSL